MTVDSRETVYFGRPTDPQVIVVWSKKEERPRIQRLRWPQPTNDEDPTIRYLDCDMQVLLETSPEPEKRSFEALSEDRHPVTNYGVTYPRRLFNAAFITHDADPIYVETVKLITAMAINVNNRSNRASNPHHRVGKPDSRRQELLDTRLEMRVDIWRILSSASLLFAEIGVDTTGVEPYVDYLTQDGLSSSTLSDVRLFSVFGDFLDKTGEVYKDHVAHDLIFEMEYLATIVFFFGHVAHNESCGDIPLRMAQAFYNFEWSCKMSKTPSVRVDESWKDQSTYFTGL